MIEFRQTCQTVKNAANGEFVRITSPAPRWFAWVSMKAPDNRFLCDCRLLWLFDLRNNTKNEDLRYTLQHVECLYDIKGIYGTPSLTHNQLKEFGRSQPQESILFDEDYYDDTGHRKP
uniref:Uncharacterized protein n=1 Tax=Anopheles maculatus TaxID=74869 RepID=A0A182S5N9_9DIPT